METRLTLWTCLRLYLTILPKALVNDLTRTLINTCKHTHSLHTLTHECASSYTHPLSSHNVSLFLSPSCNSFDISTIKIYSLHKYQCLLLILFKSTPSPSSKLLLTGVNNSVIEFWKNSTEIIRNCIKQNGILLYLVKWIIILRS